MRTILSLAVVFGLAAGAMADDPPKNTGIMPSLVLAQAASKDGKVTLKVTMREHVYFDETYTVTEEVIKKVDGKDVKKLVPVTKTRKVCKAVQKEVDVPLAVEGVTVTDLEGKALSPADVRKRLEKSTPILQSFGGAPDPYFLQTTKPDTLILVRPAPVFAPQPVMPAPPGVPVPTPSKK